MNEHITKIYDLMYDKILEVFKELEPKQESEKYFSVNCPGCGERRAFIGRSIPVIKCNRLNNCQYKSSFWDFFQKRMGWSQSETLRGMAAMVNYNLPE